MKSRTRVPIAIAFVVSVMLCALALGTWVGGRLFVPAGSGLAGPAIAIGYGVLAAGVFGAIAVLAAIFLPRRWLIVATVPAGAVAAVLLALGVWSYMIASDRTQAHLQQAYETMLPFEATIVYPESDAARPFARIEFDWEARRYTATAADGDPADCGIPLSGADAVKVLGALREVEGIVYRDKTPCADQPGSVLYQLDFTIQEAKPPQSQGSLAVTEACLLKYPGIAATIEAATDVLTRNGWPETCR